MFVSQKCRKIWKTFEDNFPAVSELSRKSSWNWFSMAAPPTRIKSLLGVIHNSCCIKPAPVMKKPADTIVIGCFGEKIILKTKKLI